MATKLYPIGIQTFSEIRRLDNLYIDKTEYVYRLTHTSGKFFFLSRPRRFGKSLLVSTLQSYFEGKRELFKNLAIEELEKEWKEYPVLHFDMSTAKHCSVERLESEISLKLSRYEALYGINSPEKQLNQRLQCLIRCVAEKTQCQVVVLVDEYDAPLLDVVHEEYVLPALRQVMRNFYSPLKDCEPMLRFVFLTGITKFSQMSIFSELNSIRNISMDTRYAGICGITEEELLTQMDEDIRSLSTRIGTTPEETVKQLKENYDGYHFTWPSPDVYNPFSLLSCLDEGKFDAYWFSTGTPTFLIELMRKFHMQPTAIGECIETPQSAFDAPTENLTSPVPLLYQSGYVTIKTYDAELDLYTLSVPNREIRIGLFRSLIPQYLTTASDASWSTIAHMSTHIKQGDMDSALHLLQTFLATVPYCQGAKGEGHYQQMLYVIFTLLTPYRISVEQHTAKGRTDMTIETTDRIYVMELKFGNTAAEAMQQIETKEYARAFSLKGKPVTKVGLAFDTDGEHNLTEWIVKDEACKD